MAAEGDGDMWQPRIVEEGTVPKLRGGEDVNALQSYNRHVVSHALQYTHPYLPERSEQLTSDNVSTAYGRRQFPRLIDQLIVTDTLTAPQIVDNLRTIVDEVSHQEKKSTAIAHGVVEASSDLLDYKDKLVQEEAARVIECCATLLEGRERLPTCGAIPRLAGLLLSSVEEKVKASSAAAFRSITTGRDGCQQLVDQGAVKAVAKYLSSVLPELPQSETLGICLLDLLKALRSVAMYAKFGCRDLVGVGVLGRCVHFLAKLPPGVTIPVVSADISTETTVIALDVLWHTANDPLARHEQLDAKGVDTVTTFLSDPRDGVRAAATRVLSLLATDLQGRVRMTEISVQPLADALQKHCMTCPVNHKVLVQTARAAAEHPPFRLAFTEVVIRETWLLKEIFGLTSIQASFPLLTHENFPTANSALDCMSFFLKGGSDTPGDEIRVPPVAPLELLESPAEFAFENCVGLMDVLLGLLVNFPVEQHDKIFDALSMVAEHDPAWEDLVHVNETRTPMVQQEVFERLFDFMDKLKKSKEEARQRAAMEAAARMDGEGQLGPLHDPSGVEAQVIFTATVGGAKEELRLYDDESFVWMRDEGITRQLLRGAYEYVEEAAEVGLLVESAATVAVDGRETVMAAGDDQILGLYEDDFGAAVFSGRNHWTPADVRMVVKQMA
mmetsp:Transcript_36275/g.79199  ORF Transcript_36275/g.79199 Transcript_36275/m.79199 type:complete len:670 (-) Transcript_36275:84-2093(-)